MSGAVLLNPKTKVIPTDHRDYPEWHYGRQQFALWYIEITDVALLEYLQYLRQLFSEFLYQPNERQFHITLFICGFLTEQLPALNDDFSLNLLQTQLKYLKQKPLVKFQLKTAQINSFESALFLEVDDSTSVLNQYRQILSQHSNEIAPLNYCPHITLGLYREAFSVQQILQKIAQIEQQNFSFDVEQLTFGCYQASQLQGTLSAHTQIQLGSSSC